MLGALSVFRKRLLDWYTRERRDLPWRVTLNAERGALPDPYDVFVSEAMLQQTQVATVIPYFRRFIERLPNFQALAEANEQEVLRLWQGLGYYSRARNLQKAAKMVVGRFGGTLPSTVEELMELPGVGRYTAGAIASLAYDRRAPILDGNVVRVLCRLDKVQEDPREVEVRDALWGRAEEVLPKKRVGDFNSALMELGATICTPRNPRCLFCPVRKHCAAFAAGAQERIPPAKKAMVRPVERRWTFCIQDGARWLIEQRPADGRWAGMWQFITVEAGEGDPAKQGIDGRLPVQVSGLKKLGEVSHGLTHRQYEVAAFVCEAEGTDGEEGGRVREWVTLDELDRFPMSKPQLRIAVLLRESGL